MNDDELLRLLQDSDFEENFSHENFDFESEEDNDDDNDYIVEQNTEVSLLSPNHTTKKYFYCFFVT